MPMFSTAYLTTGLVDPPPGRGVKDGENIMKMTSYATKIALVVMTAFFITGCFVMAPGVGYQTFGTQPYPDDQDDHSTAHLDDPAAGGGH